jgi:hypothetical protein
VKLPRGEEGESGLGTRESGREEIWSDWGVISKPQCCFISEIQFYFGSPA